MVVRKPPWKKVLYLNQPYPDNYTDKKAFLRDLRCDIKPVPLWGALFGSVLLLEEVCTVVAFVLVYVYLINEWIVPEIILNYFSILTALGYLYYRLIYFNELQNKIGHDLRTLLIFIVFGHLFSPVLYTLTDTVSTDTIYTMTFFMMLVHLIFFDYGVSAAIVSNCLSLSAAIFASICLASRLPSDYQAFILLTVAIEFFVLFPLFRKKTKNNPMTTFLLLVFDLYFLSYDKLFLTLFISLVIFINILCPVLFVNYQKYKQNIYGPWDEAVVELNKNF